MMSLMLPLFSLLVYPSGLSVLILLVVSTLSLILSCKHDLDYYSVDSFFVWDTVSHTLAT